jgi:DNA polymerase alpha subunit A
VVEAVHERLRQVAQQLRGGQLPLGSFVITKQLTKRPEDYPDARAQPHVQVRSGQAGPWTLCMWTLQGA